MLTIYYDVERARATLLKRPEAGLGITSPQMAQGIQRVFGEALSLEQAVARIIADVRARGDAAILDYTWRIDGVKLTSLEVTSKEFDQAERQIDPELFAALKFAADRIRAFHEAVRLHSNIEFSQGGLGQMVSPLQRVGIYVPGGTASYPSTVLMTAIPAKVAGVQQVVLASPPDSKGELPASTLAAAKLAGVDRIFKVGGAQAIAALAYGTESVPRVDKICGPGNAFVVQAKKMVFGTVDIDGLHGPTETMLLADASANPAWCAADLLAQAEHDVAASAIMVTTSDDLAKKVNAELESQLKTLERGAMAYQALEARGGIIVVPDIDQAIELANSYAPEHLCLVLRDAWSYVGKVKNAGGIFVGESCAEALGDYVAGPSHVMPTGGTARFASPLSLWDFVKITSLFALDQETCQALAPAAMTIARAEGLTAHARALEKRFANSKEAGDTV